MTSEVVRSAGRAGAEGAIVEVSSTYRLTTIGEHMDESHSTKARRYGQSHVARGSKPIVRTQPVASEVVCSAGRARAEGAIVEVRSAYKLPTIGEHMDESHSTKARRMERAT